MVAAAAVEKLQAAKKAAAAASAARTAPPIWAGRHGIKRVQVIATFTLVLTCY